MVTYLCVSVPVLPESGLGAGVIPGSVCDRDSFLGLVGRGPPPSLLCFQVSLGLTMWSLLPIISLMWAVSRIDHRIPFVVLSPGVLQIQECLALHTGFRAVFSVPLHLIHAIFSRLC